MTDDERPLSALDHTRIKRSLPTFEALAEQIGSRWRRSKVEDILSAGTLRLTEVASRFNPSVQEEFIAFAYPHVRGAMLREAMKTSTLQQREKAIFAMDLRDGPFDPAGKDLLSTMMTTDKAPSSKAELRAYMQLRAAGLFLAGVCAEKEQPSEDEVVARLDYKKAVSALESALEALDPRSKQLIDLLYYQQVTLDDAGEKLGGPRGKPYTKRHVSRLHEEIRSRLAEALRAAGITSDPDPEDTEE